MAKVAVLVRVERRVERADQQRVLQPEAAAQQLAEARAVKDGARDAVRPQHGLDAAQRHCAVPETAVFSV